MSQAPLMRMPRRPVKDTLQIHQPHNWGAPGQLGEVPTSGGACMLLSEWALTNLSRARRGARPARAAVCFGSDAHNANGFMEDRMAWGLRVSNDDVHM